MRLLICIFLVSLSPAVLSQSTMLSSEAQIRLVTCGPGQNELYSAFGHSAYRVVDPETGMDLIYNYGVFDFDQPNFYLNFTKGHLNYLLAKNDYSQFRDFYIRQNRSFQEQILNLSPPQKQILFEYLEWNNLPENRFYLYDYFYNNCATKITDALVAALGDDVSFDYSFIEEEKTIRQLTDDYLELQPWGDLGIDICLGMPMDIIATPKIHLFLPDYVKESFNHASVIKLGKNEPLVLETVNTYLEKPAKVPESFFSPSQIFWGLFILIGILSALDLIKGKWRIWLDYTLFTILGLLGLLLFILWVATDHNAAANNFNLLWALPLHLAGVILLIRKNRFAISYFKISTIWYMVLAILWFFLPQQMNVVLFPLVLLMATRSFICWRNSKANGIKK